jgi:hypothetical protein
MLKEKFYRAKYISGVPSWDMLEKADIDTALWLPCPPGMRAWARLCYTEEALFTRLSVAEEHILARFTGLLDMVCRDSCLEFFLSPCEGDGRYFNFEFNPLGALYLGFGGGRENSSRQIIPSYRELFNVKPFRLVEGWGIEYRIPLSFIQIFFPRFQFNRGLAMRGNFYKCGDETKTPHYLAWNPVERDTPDFHRPEYFGNILLE